MTDNKIEVVKCPDDGEVCTMTDEENFRAVGKVLHGLPEEDRNVIMDVYGRGDTLSDNIYAVSKERKINQDKIWIIVSKVTNLIAKERRLI